MATQQPNAAGGRSGQIVRISLETWLAQTKLDDVEEASVSLLQQMHGEQYGQLAAGTGAVNHTNTSAESVKVNDSSSLQTPGLLSNEMDDHDSEEYQEWLRSTEQDMEDREEIVYHDYLRDVCALSSACNDIITRVSDANELFLTMTEDHDIVENRASALHNACEELLDEQIRLTEVASALTGRLEYFAELETATRILSLPAEKIVLTDDFLSMLDRLDMCVEFFESNTSYKDADLYIVRYEQCMTRAMTLIKLYFVQTIQDLAADSARKLSAQKVGETASHALLYEKFRSVSGSLRNLISELSARSQRNEGKFTAILSECHAAYCAARLQLLTPGISSEIGKLNQGSDSLLRLARSGYSYLLEVCHLEMSLWYEYFIAEEGPLYSYLESLSDMLSDLLRPRILRETDLNLLSQLCMTLQSVSTSNDAQGSGQDGEANEPVVSMTYLFRNILQDVQSRLIFRAQQIVDAEIRNFNPKSSDLDYPAILIKAKAAEKDPETALKKENGADKECEDTFVKMPLQSEQETWYPTLKKVVWVLSKLYSYLNSAVFDGIAQDAIAAYRMSLHTAEAQLATSRSGLDARLFAIRHLLLLRKGIARFDLEISGVKKGMDFSQLSTTLEDLRFATGYFNPFALMKAASNRSSQVDQSLKNARVSLKADLDQARSEVVAEISGKASSPLLVWLGEERPKENEKAAGPEDSDQQQRDRVRESLATAMAAYKSSLEIYSTDIERVRLYVDENIGSAGLIEELETEVRKVEDAFGRAASGIWPSDLVRVSSASVLSNGPKAGLAS